MDWQTYSDKFQIKAREAQFGEDDIDKCLQYASNLFSKDLPIIYDQRHLSLLVGYDERFLIKISNSSGRFYRNFKIPKKSGGQREIAEPLPSLKEIQGWILNEILYKCSVSRFAKAYVPGRSIKENARFHAKQNVVLTIDIEDFFGSIKFGKILAFYRNLGYSKPVAVMLANLSCLNGCLPQGAPTSPALSNLVTLRLDYRIFGFSRKYKIRYTRYADDLTFSGDFEPGMVIKFVRQVLNDEKLQINEDKIRARYQHQRQEVTGVVVNRKLQAPRELRRSLRQAVYFIEKYGLASHLQATENQRANHIKHLLGIANFILFINPKDGETQKYAETLKRYLHD